MPGLDAGTLHLAVAVAIQAGDADAPDEIARLIPWMPAERIAQLVDEVTEHEYRAGVWLADPERAVFLWGDEQPAAGHLAEWGELQSLAEIEAADAAIRAFVREAFDARPTLRLVAS